MKAYTPIGIAPWVSLLNATTLSSCVNARQSLGMDQQQQGDRTQQKHLANAGADHTSDGGISIADPMLFSPQTMVYLQKHDFAVESIASLPTKGLNIDAKHQKGGTLLLCLIFDHLSKTQQCISNDDDNEADSKQDKKVRLIKDCTESTEQFPAT